MTGEEFADLCLTAYRQEEIMTTGPYWPCKSVYPIRFHVDYDEVRFRHHYGDSGQSDLIHTETYRDSVEQAIHEGAIKSFELFLLGAVAGDTSHYELRYT